MPAPPPAAAAVAMQAVEGPVKHVAQREVPRLHKSLYELAQDHKESLE